MVRSPYGAVAPVACQLADCVERGGQAEDEYRVVVVRGALNALRCESARRAAPALPPPRRVEVRGHVGRAERAEVVGAADHALDCVHHRVAVAAPATALTDGHALDVAGPQCAAGVEQAALDDRRVAGQLAVLV